MRREQAGNKEKIVHAESFACARETVPAMSSPLVIPTTGTRRFIES